VSLLFDQNLSRRLPIPLAAEYLGSEQVFLAGLATTDDRAVWGYAAAHGLAVVSKDADFARLSAAHCPPPKVLCLRIRNGPTRDVASDAGRCCPGVPGRSCGSRARVTVAVYFL
jgi:predicted nuclease of predicted toxin-antitoxin system